MTVHDSSEPTAQSETDWRYGDRERLHARLVEEDFDIFDGARVFEITVGDRSLAGPIAEMHDDISICSMDLSDPRRPCENEHALVGLPTDGLFPLLSDSYDRGFCYASLASLGGDRIREVLREAFRVLRTGGRFRFAVPDREDATIAGDADGFSRAEVFALVEELLGFRVVSMRRFNPDAPNWDDRVGDYFLFDVRKPEQN